MRHKPLPKWLLLLVVGALAGVLVLQTGDRFGDQGLCNVASYLLGALALGASFLWFVLASARSARTRGLVALVVIGGTGLFLALWRLEGFSGAMVPHFRLRSAQRAALAPAPSRAAQPSAAQRAATELATPAEFPGFFGPARDGRVRGVRLARDWRARPPELLWRRPVGDGWSGFAVAGTVAVTLEERAVGEVLVAYDLQSGAELWAAGAPGHFDHYLGGRGPRGTPAIAGGRVVALGARGRLACHELADGHLVWERDLLAEGGLTSEREAELVAYGRSNSPLVVGELVIVPIGGDPERGMKGLAALALADGAWRWQGPARQVSFSSPTLVELGGVTQLVIVNEASISGHALADGALLWEHPRTGTTSADANVSQPLIYAQDSILVTKGYGLGAELLRVAWRAPAWEVTSQWANRRALRTKFTSAVIAGEHAYGLSDGILECVRLRDGERVWRDGRYGHGQLLLVEDLLLVLSEEGELVLVDPRPEPANLELGRVSVLSGKTWNNLALAGDVLLVRNGSEASAWRLATEGEAGIGVDVPARQPAENGAHPEERR